MFMGVCLAAPDICIVTGNLFVYFLVRFIVIYNKS